jgi:hypothetical protein
MRPLLLIAIVLSLACDLEDLAGTGGSSSDALAKLPAPEEVKKDPPSGVDPNDAAKLPSPEAAYPNDASQRRDCLGACAKLEGSEDDRATCRLACSPDPSVLEQAVRRYLECHAGCPEPAEGAQASCERGCREAMSATFLPNGSTASGCSDPCFETLNACELACQGEKRKDRSATCTLQCETAATSCLEACPYLDQ